MLYNFCLQFSSINKSKKQNPEIINGNDLIQTPDTDDVNRTKDSKAITYYLSIEKSMSQVINDEIMNWFATIKGYNNLMGFNKFKYSNFGIINLNNR